MKRREFIKTVGAAGVAGTTQMPSPAGRKIDIHNHYYPASYFELIEQLHTANLGYPGDRASRKHRAQQVETVEPFVQVASNIGDDVADV